MKKATNADQTMQRVEALQHEAARLAEQAREQLAEYARTFDSSKQGKIAKAAVRDGREQIQHAAAQVSDQVAATMAIALEDAAGRLRSYPGGGPAAQVAQHAAGALEQGSERLQPWSRRSVVRRLTRVVQRYPWPALLLALSALGAAFLTSRGRRAS
jgi:hypothetical protein